MIWIKLVQNECGQAAGSLILWFRTRARAVCGGGLGLGSRKPEPEAAQLSGCQEQNGRRDTSSGATRKEQNSAVFLGLAPCLRGGPGGGEFTTITLKSRGRGFQNHFVIANKISKIYGCTDHVTDHALITWLSCTAHVADHALITWLIIH